MNSVCNNRTQGTVNVILLSHPEELLFQVSSSLLVLLVALPVMNNQACSFSHIKLHVLQYAQTFANWSKPITQSFYDRIQRSQREGTSSVMRHNQNMLCVIGGISIQPYRMLFIRLCPEALMRWFEISSNQIQSSDKKCIGTVSLHNQ